MEGALRCSLGSQAQHTHSLEDHTWSIQQSTTTTSSEQTGLPSSNHACTGSMTKHIHHHYAPSVTSTPTTHVVYSTSG